MTEAEWLFGLLALGMAAAMWHEGLRAREYALIAITRTCRELDVQLLDQTVAARKLTLKRGQRGWLQVHRTFEFDVSLNGADRHRGYAQMAGSRVVTLHVPSRAGSTIINYS